ncbi:Methionine import system permease protein MetP [termite gut metagenome]|uniref:Methionine import system permease protein MetP n=1 Tax=termite gut metagenome TaxID=433724 RepID=A0A5J4RK23_9ZZZZ
MKSLSLSELLSYLKTAFYETFLMCGVSLVVSVIVGIIIGLAIYTTRDGIFWQNKTLNFLGGLLINIIRSIPFILVVHLANINFNTVHISIKEKQIQVLNHS